MANSSSKYPIPPPRGRSTKSTITRERSDAPLFPPRPEQEFYQGQGEWGPVQTTRYKNTPSRDLRRNDYDPWKAGREHDAKQGVSATGDEMLPFTAVAGLPAARLIPAAVRGVVGAGKYAAAPAAEILRRGGDRLAPVIQRNVGRVGEVAQKAGDKLNQLATSKAVMPTQRAVNRIAEIGTSIEKHPVSQALGLGPKGTTFSTSGGSIKAPGLGKIPFYVAKAAEEGVFTPKMTGGIIDFTDQVADASPTSEQLMALPEAAGRGVGDLVEALAAGRPSSARDEYFGRAKF